MKIFLGLVLILNYSAALAGLSGQFKSVWVASYVPACFKLQKEMALNSSLSDERLSKYCTCMGMTASENVNLDNELAILINKKEATYPADMNSSASKYCGTNWGKFSSGAIQRPISQNGNGLFDGKTRRFTAFRQIIFTKEWIKLEVNEVANGRMLMDINIQIDRPENSATDITNGISYKLSKVDTLTAFAKTIGYDFQFLGASGGPTLTFKTETGLLTTDYLNIETGRVYQTDYIDTNVLICKSLSAAKNKYQVNIFSSIIKEAMLIAIKSRAGASYSGGNFYGSSSSGATVSGTYTQYNNSWLGEHYSRGLDAVFDGTATVSQIDDEMSKLSCH